MSLLTGNLWTLSLSPMMCPWLFWLPLEVSIAQLFPQEARTVEVIPKPILYKQSLKVSSLWTRFEKRRVQEELEVLSSKLTRLRSHQEGSPPIERLQDDIKHYKAMIKCSVCHDRSKEVSIYLYAPLVSEICSYMWLSLHTNMCHSSDLTLIFKCFPHCYALITWMHSLFIWSCQWLLQVVITKCYHLFCGPCIQRNLEIRHRKCPGCGVPFGQSDVRNVYI